MGQNTNYERYPLNVFKPEEITVDRSRYKYYLVRFDNLYELHDYLKSNPNVNKEVFHELSSRTGGEKFAGMPYDKAVDDLINSEDAKYFEFVNLIKEIINVKHGDTHKYRTVQTLAGGHINTPLYSAGVPLCYETEERITKPKYITLYSALSYSGSTIDEQIFNRAVILISIINALEKRGYSIRLNAFEMSSCGDEVVNNVIGLKQHGSKINIPALYKTSFKKEFLRRILFGVLETVGVENAWGGSYGKSCDEGFVREVLHVKKEDIYFGTPQELGITGGNLEKDFMSVLKKLKLEENVDIRSMSDDFRENAKRLIK